MEKTLNELCINYDFRANKNFSSSIDLYFALIQCYLTLETQIISSNFFSLDVNSQFILFSGEIFNAPNVQERLYSFLRKDSDTNEYKIKFQNAPNSCFEINYNNKTSKGILLYNGYNPQAFECSFLELTTQIMSFLAYLVFVNNNANSSTTSTGISIRSLLSHSINIIAPFCAANKTRFELMLLDTRLYCNSIIFIELCQSLLLFSLFSGKQKPIQIISYKESGEYNLEFNITTKQNITEINFPTYFRETLKIENFKIKAYSKSQRIILKLTLPCGSIRS